MYIMGFVSPFDRENVAHSSAGCAHISDHTERLHVHVRRCTVFITARSATALCCGIKEAGKGSKQGHK